MKKIFSIPRSDVLLVAATVVAALRLMLINGAFIDFDLKQWRWFAPAEVWSGITFAILEGLALAYVSERWRKLNPKTAADWVYWGILLIGQIILLAAIVWVTAWAATALRRGITIDQLLGPGAAVIWSMCVAAINPLIVILIGIVRDSEVRRGIGGPQGGPENYSYAKSGGDTGQPVEKPFAHLVRKAQARGLLDRWEQANGKQTPTILWLIGEFRRVIGEELLGHEADEVIVEWRRERGIAGRRPKEEGEQRSRGAEGQGSEELDLSLISENGTGEK